jgi:hypothetical protein
MKHCFMTPDALDGLAVFVAVAEAMNFLYYPQRRHASPALHALIDHVRGAREAARGLARSEAG